MRRVRSRKQEVVAINGSSWLLWPQNGHKLLWSFCGSVEPSRVVNFDRFIRPLTASFTIAP